MFKLDTEHITNIIKAENNFSGYHEVCYTVLSVFRFALLRDINFIPIDSAFINSNMSLWRKVLLKNPDTLNLRFAVFIFIDINNKRAILFQFSYNDKEELKLIALFAIDYKANRLFPKFGWSFLIDNEQKPYSIGDFSVMFIETFLDEIRYDLIQTFNNLSNF